MYWLSGCVLCFWISRPTASCGMDVCRTEVSVFGLERITSPLGLRTYCFAQSADQLQAEHGQDVSGIGGVQIRLEVFGQERFHLHFPYFRSDAVIGRVARNEPLHYRALKGAVKGEVDAPRCGAAQAGVAFAAACLDATFLHQVFVELLEVTGGRLLEFDLADSGTGAGSFR